MAELIPTSTEEEWLAARMKGITASEIAVVMGLSPWSSPYKLFHQKAGILPRDEVTPAMERGTYLEPYVCDWFAAAHPEYVVTGNGRQLYARDWQLATPDRLLCECAWVDDDGNARYPEPLALLEVKTTTDMDGWGEPGTNEIPVHYRAQVLWQLDVMGLNHAYVAVLDVRRWEVSEYEVPWDAAAQRDVELMRDEAWAFLKRLENQDPPDVDWSPATIGALKALHPSVTDEDATVGHQLARNYRAAAKNEKHWAERKKLYEAQLRERMGSARRAVTPAGEVIARRDVYEVRESVRKGYTVDKLVSVPPKKES